MLSLKPPKTSYSNTRDIGRFNMIWNISLVLMPIFFVLFLITALFGSPSYITALIAWCLTSLNLLLLYRSRKFILVTWYSLILSSILLQLLIFVIDESRLVPAVLWVVMLSFFAYFMLGAKIGQLVLLINVLGVLVFMSFGSAETIMKHGFNWPDVNVSLIVDVAYVTFALVFFMHKFLETNRSTNRLYEDQIKKNEVLLKEIHHRVKNNLQIISSLLKLQASENGNVEVEEQFQEAIGRIRSMALIHEKMYQNDDLSSIDINSYLTTLANDIIESFNSKNRIKLSVICDIGRIDIKSMVPISLIFNELITNSVKHGFTNTEEGNITIQIQRTNGHISFLYSDNGTWKEPEGELSFGLELLSILTNQLDGKYTRQTVGETKYEFLFDAEHFLFNA